MRQFKIVVEKDPDGYVAYPLSEHPGESIQIFILGKDEESHLWRKAAKEHFLKSYDISDAIYG